MSRWVRAAAGGMGAVLSFSMLIAPAIAAGPAQQALAFPPPTGMTLHDGKPSNGLMLRARRGIDPVFLRQIVGYSTNEHPGTVVVDTGHKFLYLVLGNGWALRYGIGTAKTGFEWGGTHQITNKREWPDWTPPSEMLARRPELPRHMDGGINNPLGARALYIGATLYRIHGTNEPWTIGGNVSSGCIRMTNEDVTDLFGRVKIGSKVIVL
jgi:lipoprotein-anchoring transpeptidase ErfK/SrfK